MFAGAGGGFFSSYLDRIAEKRTIEQPAQAKVGEQIAERIAGDGAVLARRVDEQVRIAVDKSLSSVRDETVSRCGDMEFMVIVDALSQPSSYTNAETQAVVSFLQRDAANDLVKRSPNLLTCLEEASDFIYEAGMAPRIDESVGLYQTEAMGHTGILPPLLLKDGLQFFVGRNAPAAWNLRAVERMQTAFARLRQGLGGPARCRPAPPARALCDSQRLDRGSAQSDRRDRRFLPRPAQGRLQRAPQPQAPRVARQDAQGAPPPLRRADRDARPGLPGRVRRSRLPVLSPPGRLSRAAASPTLGPGREASGHGGRCI